MKNRIVHISVISVFVMLYFAVSIISTIHVVDFFKLTNTTALAISLAVAFELGAAASLASIIVLDKMNKGLIWGLFIILTLMQAMGNMYYAYTNAHDFLSWVELFGLVNQDVIMQKRILAGVSGAILPLIALGFIKSLVDYIRPPKEEPEEINEEINDEDEANEEILEKPIDVLLDGDFEELEKLAELVNPIESDEDKGIPEPINDIEQDKQEEKSESKVVIESTDIKKKLLTSRQKDTARKLKLQRSLKARKLTR